MGLDWELPGAGTDQFQLSVDTQSAWPRAETNQYILKDGKKKHGQMDQRTGRLMDGIYLSN